MNTQFFWNDWFFLKTVWSLSVKQDIAAGSKKKKKKKTVSRSLLLLWESWNIPDPDKGHHFMEEVITTMLKASGIKQKLLSLYHSQSSEQVRAHEQNY